MRRVLQTDVDGKAASVWHLRIACSSGEPAKTAIRAGDSTEHWGTNAKTAHPICPNCRMNIVAIAGYVVVPGPVLDQAEVNAAPTALAPSLRIRC